ncbi:MAG: PhzF family phenazine biosynthesis protein [Turicibacter sp.]|nr:PhzF family phenazine biosynthesis protein [Turicibacter sp.]
MKYYQVDSFADTLFKGNPAGVCLLENTWLDSALMQNIAMENNLSETAFVLHDSNTFSIRWFAPLGEVELCGHATLAAAHILLSDISGKREIVFDSKQGKLTAKKIGSLIELDFPADNIYQIPISEAPACFDQLPKEVWCGREEYMLIFDSENVVRNIQCDYNIAANIDLSGVIITAASSEYDFIMRYFCPKYGINEDPVTGSSLTLLAPYWQKKLGKNTFKIFQASKRGGELFCRLEGQRVKIAGHAITYMSGDLYVDRATKTL